MNTYTKLVVVAEEEWFTGQQNRNICLYNTIWKTIEGIGAEGIDAVYCERLLPDSDKCHAEMLFISGRNAIAAKIRKEFQAADYAEDDFYRRSVVIRILEDKQKFLEKFDNRSAADVNFVVNGEEIKGDRKNLAAVSPVFNRMLYEQFAHHDKIALEGIESAELFKDFLLAVSPIHVQPNPNNVVALLKLAHQYDIPLLLRNCENHLMYCYEIPIADRLLLAGKYDLDCLKVRITLQLSTGELKRFIKEKYQQLREFGPDFILYLASILIDRKI